MHGMGDPADTVGANAGPVYGGSPSRPSLSLHGQTSPFAAWSAQGKWDSNHGCSIHHGLAKMPSRCVRQAALQGSPESSGAAYYCQF